MEVQARAEFAPEDRVAGDFQVAGAQWVVLPEKLQQVVCVRDRAVRPEIGAVLPVHTPGQIDLRKLVVGDDDPRVGLGILQQDVVVRLVLLDEVVLQQQCVRLGIHHGELRVGDLRDQDPSLHVQPLRRHKVLSHPLVQVFGLAHINHLPRGIVVTIDPRGMWKQGDFLPDCKIFPAQSV